MRNLFLAGTACLAAVLCVPASAQTAAASASAPVAQGSAKIPDLSGVWQKTGGGPGLLPVDQEPPLTAWGRERFNLAKPIHGPRTTDPSKANAPELTCFPPGLPSAYFRPRPFEIVQEPDRAIMLFEVNNFWRIIYMDGRDFPKVPLHTWNGYAIGHYEGDALVIETRQVRGWQSEKMQRWLDRLGYPFSDELHLTERFRRVDHDTLRNDITIDDPIAYTKPWNAVMTYRLRNFELAEFICEELMLSDLPAIRPGQE